MAEKLINVGDNNIVSAIFGELDATASFIEKEYGVTLTDRDNHIKITSDNEENVRLAANVIDYLIGVVKVNETLTEQNVRYAMCMVNDGNYGELAQLDQDCICITFKGKPIKAKTIGQRKYVEAIKKNTIVFGIGPAGTGKTFLAVAMAVTALRQKMVDRIILTRPAVEAGERLGFLPGDLQSKIDPYLRPLYDALFEMMGYEGYQKNVEKGIIEIAPLAYMRGRTLDNAFIILDEAQNTTAEQMKMFLTRLGFGSRAVVTGDITQVDLPEGKRSGLVEASRILKGIDQINIHTFTEKDVVRHALVQKIIVAYDKYETERNKKREKENQQ